ncbi:MAG TPA: TldD/PmbA family protein [Coleofasciculaceae cyanobacterium]
MEVSTVCQRILVKQLQITEGRIVPTIQELATQTNEIADRLGIHKFDIYGATVDETSVKVDQGKADQVKASNRSSVTVRVWNQDQTVGITSTTDVDPRGLELALKTAYEASFFGTKDNVPDFSPEATTPIAHPVVAPAAQVPVSELLENLINTEKQLLAAHPAIAGVPYNGLAQRHSDRFYLNSAGAMRTETRTTASIYLYSKTEEEGKKPRSAGAFRISRGLNSLDIEGCLQETAEKTISHLDYHSIPTGKYLVVFSPEAFLSLLGAFSNLFNAQNILDKQSLSTPESLGTPIAAPVLSVCDDALHPDNAAAITFDGEGTPTRRTPLITDGILTGFLHSAGTARRLNAHPTGHASMGAKVTVSPHFFHVFAGQPAAQSYDLETAEAVILIDDVQALHAGVKALQGSFSLPFDGWLLNRGSRTSIESATVAGDFLDLLKNIIYVGQESHLTAGGLCPYVWVNELSITGEGAV